MRAFIAALDRCRGMFEFFGTGHRTRRTERSINLRHSCRLSVEPLEQRTLLSASLPLTAPALALSTPVSVSTLEPVAKTDSVVASGLHNVQQTILTQLSEGKSSLQSLSSSVVHVDNAGRMQVYVYVSQVTDAMIASLKSAGLAVETSNADMHVVQGWVSAASLNNLATVTGVQSVTPPAYAIVNTGNINSAGDGILNADDVRSQFAAYGINGSGIKVGVISDGVAHLADVQATGDLSTVNVNSVGSGSEGTAMLEIIHDLAPGAELYFSPCGTSVDMVDSIAWLRNQGCNVIVDDVGYLDQPFFQDGSVANAAASAVSAGVVYVTAAGNEGSTPGYPIDGHYQGQYTPFGGTNYQTFGTGNVLPFATGTGYVAGVLQWSNAWGSATDSYDLDLYGWNGSTWVAVAATHYSLGTGNPGTETIYYNTSYSEMGWVVEKVSGSSQELELYFFGDQVGTFSNVTYTQSDSIFGQGAVTSVITVGAIDAADSGNDAIEPFSSRGQSTVYDFTSQPATKTMRSSIDLCAIDGVQTEVGYLGYFGTSSYFYGTSAAAPHVAAIAALLLDANASLTPSQVSAALNNTAVDLTAYGTGYDNASGYGRADALNAVYSVFTPAVPDLLAADDSGGSSTDNITNDTTPRFTGTVPVGSYVRLYVDGNQVGSQQLGSAESTYTITASTLSSGTHQVTVKVAASSTGALSNASSALAITIDTAGPTIDYLTQVTPSPRNTAVASDHFMVSDAASGLASTITYANFSLTRNGTPVTLSSDVTVMYEIYDFVVQGLQSYTSTAGTYVLTLSASGIQDGAGNFGSGSASTTWTMDTTAPTVTDVVDVTPDPRTTAVSTVNVTFSEAINLSTFTYEDLSLTRSGSNVPLNGSVTMTGSGPTYQIGGLSAFTGSAGTYVLTVNAAGIQDLAGNSGTGSANDTWVNNAPPTFSVNSPASGSFVSGNTVGIQWSATNVIPGSTVALCWDTDTTWNGNQHWLTTTVTAANGTYTYNWNTQGMATGTYYVAGYLYQDGQATYSHLSTSFTIAPATFDIWGPQSGTFAAGTTIGIAWNTNVTNPNETISLCYDSDTTINGNEHWIEVDQLQAVSGNHIYDWTSTSITPGLYYLGGYLWNGSLPTYAHTAAPFRIQNFTVNGPSSGTYIIGSTVPIQWSAGNVTPGTVYSLCRDPDSGWNGNESWITVDQTAQNGTYSYNWNTTGMTPGTYYFGGYLYQNGQPVYSHLTTAITLAAPLMLATPEVAPQSLTADNVLRSDDQLTPIVTEAIRRWAVATGNQQALAGVTVQVADLPGNLLGEAYGKTIVIDRDAAGYGWFIDSTPQDDVEYALLSRGQLAAQQNSEAVQHADLLTTVMHEMGHLLGYRDVDDGLMGAGLSLGVRWSATADDAFAQYALV